MGSRLPIGESAETTAAAFQIAMVMLLDSQGRILLQLRDGNTSIDPHRWCLPGGAVEPGETPAVAALRELLEETGLRPDTGLVSVWQGLVPSERFRGAVVACHAFLGWTAAGQDDVQCNEGNAMVFTPIDQIAKLELGHAHRMIVPAVLASPLFAAACAPRPSVTG
ncbi:NUDIX domain-containing protein [Actinomycetes bacterium KLBMP 9797]